MGRPIVHVEVSGTDPQRLRTFYGSLFDWEFDTSGLVAPEVSDAGQYGFVEPGEGAQPAPAGVGGGPGHPAQAIFYVSVPDVEVALAAAERLGGVRVMGPSSAPDRPLVVGHFRDPEGTLVGLAARA